MLSTLPICTVGDDLLRTMGPLGQAAASALLDPGVACYYRCLPCAGAVERAAFNQNIVHNSRGETGS
jgi:hypothetical protein